jgi:hypothetical protein
MDCLIVSFIGCVMRTERNGTQRNATQRNGAERSGVDVIRKYCVCWTVFDFNIYIYIYIRIAQPFGDAVVVRWWWWWLLMMLFGTPCRFLTGGMGMYGVTTTE